MDRAVPAAALAGHGATCEVGSVPGTDPEAAAREALALHPALPSAPEMPRRDPREGILARVLAAVALVEDPQEGRLAVPAADPSLAAAFDEAAAGAEPPERAAGFAAFLEALARSGRRGPAKAAVVGPVALAATLRGRDGRSVAAVPAAADAVARWVARRAVALAGALARAGAVPVVQVDEPGSTDDLSPAEAARLRGVLDAVRAAGALAAVHDCGARRGEGLLALGADLVLADAAGEAPALLSVPAALAAHLARGGAVAWGIVPTRAPFPDGAAARALLARVAAAGLDPALVRARSWLSPACGLGASSPAEAAGARAALEAARRAWT